MKIYMHKIGMIRQDMNPKNSTLNLDIDWTIDYLHKDPKNIDFNILIKSLKSFDFNVKIEGILELNSNEEFNQEEVSQIIFQKACSVFMDMISITRQSTHILSNCEESFGLDSAPIQSTLFN
ncbi:MAG: hypothetical protein IJ258_07475 [Methanobrevibacter sp.]|uniref:hypothetical protein n=1 Tax=Methanobrevibacter sp. TaxID=66852 RepID=UPI0025EB8594|nr:hypothetical protein [Methanobrevibacter sp.]MBQ8017930.1 hypothetical protein [Methanobrevibacter sp.]